MWFDDILENKKEFLGNLCLPTVKMYLNNQYFFTEENIEKFISVAFCLS